MYPVNYYYEIMDSFFFQKISIIVVLPDYGTVDFYKNKKCYNFS